MNELTVHPSLTSNGVGQINSKPKGDAQTSGNNNEEILGRTAHSAVLSVSKGKLHAQREGSDAKTADDHLVIDDVSVSKKSASSQDRAEAEVLATKKDQNSKQDQGSSGDSESFSEAQTAETIDKKSESGDENLKQLVTALNSLKKNDCIRVLEASDVDPGHAITNLWDTESNKRLSDASQLVEGFEKRLKAKIVGFDNFKEFEVFVISHHANSSDKALAEVLYNVAEGFSHGQEKRISGFDPKSKDEYLRNLFEFFQNEDHRIQKAQAGLIKDINLVYLKAALKEDQGNEKLHYRLEAAVKFSRVKKINPLERLRQRVVEKFGDDKKIRSKAKSFKETTDTNWSTLIKKITHTVTEFSQILFSGLFSLLNEVNEKVGKDLAAKPAPAFVRPTRNGKKPD